MAFKRSAVRSRLSPPNQSQTNRAVICFDGSVLSWSCRCQSGESRRNGTLWKQGAIPFCASKTSFVLCHENTGRTWRLLFLPDCKKAVRFYGGAGCSRGRTCVTHGGQGRAAWRWREVERIPKKCFTGNPGRLQPGRNCGMMEKKGQAEQKPSVHTFTIGSGRYACI